MYSVVQPFSFVIHTRCVVSVSRLPHTLVYNKWYLYTFWKEGLFRRNEEHLIRLFISNNFSWLQFLLELTSISLLYWIIPFSHINSFVIFNRVLGKGFTLFNYSVQIIYSEIVCSHYFFAYSILHTYCTYMVNEKLLNFVSSILMA